MDETLQSGSERGAPVGLEQYERVEVTLDLPRWQVEWLGRQSLSVSQLVEAALWDAYRLESPKVEQGA